MSILNSHLKFTVIQPSHLIICPDIESWEENTICRDYPNLENHATLTKIYCKNTYFQEGADCVLGGMLDIFSDRCVYVNVYIYTYTGICVYSCIHIYSEALYILEYDTFPCNI